MKRKRFSEEQIIRILKEDDVFGNVREVCRQYKLRSRPFIDGKINIVAWRSLMPGNSGGGERENAQLKEFVAELTLDTRMLQDVLSKKW